MSLGHSVEYDPRTAAAVDEVRDLPGDELLHVPVGSVVVRAAGNRCLHAEGAHPGAHDHVRGRPGGAERGGRALRGLPGESRRVVERGHDAVGGQPRDVFGAPSVGQLVQHGHEHAGVVLDDASREIVTDEATAARDESIAGIEGTRHSEFPPRMLKPGAIAPSSRNQNAASPGKAGTRHTSIRLSTRNEARTNRMTPSSSGQWPSRFSPFFLRQHPESIGTLHFWMGLSGRGARQQPPSCS